MKKSILLLVGFALLGGLIVSCNKTEGMLNKAWKVSDVEAKGIISDSIRNVIISTGNLTFTKDGKVSGNLLGTVSGTYELSKDGKTITIKDELGTPESYNTVIEEDKLILDGKEAKLIFSSK